MTVTDAGGTSGVTGSAQVSPAPSYVVANFSSFDPNNPYSSPPASAFTALINWGDGTSPPAGTVTSGGYGGYGGFAVSAPHAYAEEGTYNVAVTVAGPGGPATFLGTASVTATALLAASAPQTPAAAPTAQIDPVTSGTKIDPNGPINQIANPAGIVIEDKPTVDNTALIKITNVVGNLKASDVLWTIEGVNDKLVGKGSRELHDPAGVRGIRVCPSG